MLIRFNRSSLLTTDNGNNGTTIEIYHVNLQDFLACNLPRDRRLADENISSLGSKADTVVTPDRLKLGSNYFIGKQRMANNTEHVLCK